MMEARTRNMLELESITSVDENGSKVLKKKHRKQKTSSSHSLDKNLATILNEIMRKLDCTQEPQSDQSGIFPSLDPPSQPRCLVVEPPRCKESGIRIPSRIVPVAWFTGQGADVRLKFQTCLIHGSSWDRIRGRTTTTRKNSQLSFA